MTGEEQRRELLAQAYRHERELQQAVSELRGAVQRPLQVATRLRAQLDGRLPWMIGGLLLGIWLGSRRNGQEET